MWTTNLASSLSQVNTDLVHRDPRFPSPSSFPPLKPLPWAWQRAIVCVCVCASVCVRINFLFYRGSSVCMYRSLFRFSLWEKSTEKKRLCQFSWICMGTTSIVSGKLPYFLSKNIFWFTGKVQMQCLNQTEKRVISLFQSTKKSQNTTNYHPFISNVLLLLPDKLIKLRADWLDTESCGHYAIRTIYIRASRTSKWKLAAVVLARLPSNHGLSHRSAIQWSDGFL